MSTEIIKQDGIILAIIAKIDEIKDNLKFFSTEDFSLQVGIHNKEKGFCIGAHEHIPFPKLENYQSQEAFYIKKGKVEVGIYHQNKKIISKILSEGEFIILNTGHDLKFLEDTQLFEIKQGPYRGKDGDKKDISPKNENF